MSKSSEQKEAQGYFDNVLDIIENLEAANQDLRDKNEALKAELKEAVDFYESRKAGGADDGSN